MLFTFKLKSCINVIKPLFKEFISWKFRRRRNANYAKLTDVEVLALLCFQVLLGITVRTRFYRFLLYNQVLGPNKLPEKSRFNRICNRDGIILQIIRYQLIKEKLTVRYSIIDSFPMPLCKNVRNTKATLLKKYANIGFNSTKHIHYYGFKGSFEVSNQGIPLAYTITKASIHDIKMIKTLIYQYRCPYILVDEGYISSDLKSELSRHGIWFWTPKRANMASYPYDDSLLSTLKLYFQNGIAYLMLNITLEDSLKAFNVG